MAGDIVQLLIDSISALGYPGIFLLMAMESSIFPVPSELVMPPAGYLAEQGSLNVWLVILMGTFGSLAGAYGNYFAARTLGRPFILKYGKYFLVPEEKFYRIERIFLEYGEIATFIGRLLPVIRHLISIPAGLSCMNHLRFSIYTLLGAFIWCTLLTWLGYALGHNQELILQYSQQLVFYTVAAGCMLILLSTIRRYRKRRRITISTQNHKEY